GSHGTRRFCCPHACPTFYRAMANCRSYPLGLRRAKTAQSLVAARAVLESPQQAWAQIGGVTLTTYIGVVAGAGVSLANMGMDDAAASMTNAEINLLTDLRTGV